MATRASNRAAIQEATETRCEYGLGWDRPNPQDVLAAPNRKAEEQGREVVGGRRKLEPEKPPDDQDFSAPAIEQRQQQKEAADEAAARREEADAEALYLEEWERREAAEAELTLARTRSAEKNQLLSAAKANLASLQAKAKIDKPPSGTLYLPRRFAVLAVARCKPASFVVVWGAYVRSVALSPCACRPVLLLPPPLPELLRVLRPASGGQRTGGAVADQEKKRLAKKKKRARQKASAARRKGSSKLNAWGGARPEGGSDQISPEDPRTPEEIEPPPEVERHKQQLSSMIAAGMFGGGGGGGGSRAAICLGSDRWGQILSLCPCVSLWDDQR